MRELLGCLSTAELVQISHGENGALLYHLEDGAKKDLQGRTGAIIGFPSVLASLMSPVKGCISAEGPYGEFHYYFYIVKGNFDFFPPLLPPKSLNIQYSVYWTLISQNQCAMRYEKKKKEKKRKKKERKKERKKSYGCRKCSWKFNIFSLPNLLWWTKKHLKDCSEFLNRITIMKQIITIL